MTSNLFKFLVTFFLNLWKRRESKLKMRWNLDFEELDTDIRLQYIEKTKTRRINVFSGEEEPYTTQTKKTLKMTFTVMACAFMIGIVLAVVIALIALKVYVFKWCAHSNVTFFATNARGFTMTIASALQVIFIKIYSKVYGPFSMWLTKFELPKTQQDFDNSVLYKKYILAFTNNYASLFYLAFFKGWLFVAPHREEFAIHEKDMCQPNTCTVPLCVQLAFILTLKTFAGNIFTLSISYFTKFFKKFKKSKVNVAIGEWEEQFYLEPTTRFFITGEFLEMIIRVGFVTFFVAAFPLAPLCIYLNNLIELRSDAYKMIRFCRRPVPLQKSGIGPWNGILLGMMFISTVTNAFVVSFTNDFVARRLYELQHGSLKGFINTTLTSKKSGASSGPFIVSDNEREKYEVEDYATPDRNFNRSITHCFYRGKRFSSEYLLAQGITKLFWVDLMWRMIAVLVFEYCIFLFNTTLSYAIPKIPLSVRLQLNLDRQLAKEAKINAISDTDDDDDNKSKDEEGTKPDENQKPERRPTATDVSKSARKAHSTRRRHHKRDRSGSGRNLVGAGPIVGYL